MLTTTVATALTSFKNESLGQKLRQVHRSLWNGPAHTGRARLPFADKCQLTAELKHRGFLSSVAVAVDPVNPDMQAAIKLVEIVQHLQRFDAIQDAIESRPHLLQLRRVLDLSPVNTTARWIQLRRPMRRSGDLFGPKARTARASAMLSLLGEVGFGVSGEADRAINRLRPCPEQSENLMEVCDESHVARSLPGLERHKTGLPLSSVACAQRSDVPLPQPIGESNRLRLCPEESENRRRCSTRHMLRAVWPVGTAQDGTAVEFQASRLKFIEVDGLKLGDGHGVCDFRVVTV